MKHLFVASILSATSFAAAAADTYVIDPTHTFTNFEVSHLGFSTSRGRFDKTEGTIVLDLKKKTGSADVTIDANSLSTGVAKLDDHLKNPDFFEVGKYPVIVFKSRALKFDGDTLVSVSGDLQMHGVTRPVTLAVTHFACKEHPMRKTPHCGADATATIRRSDWGMTAYVPAVGDEVKLSIQVEAAKQ